jgi:hypothetical protein
MEKMKIYEEAKERLFQPCPLYEEGFVGRCKECLERQECILLTVLGTLQKIETKLNGLETR